MEEFFEDVKERKELAKSNRYKGHTAHGCKLPYEYLPKKERENLNGEVSSVKLNKPMTWKEFKKLPKGLQEEYLNHLIDCFNVSASKIGVDMFGLCPSGLAERIKRYKIATRSKQGAKLTTAEAEAWHKWLNGESSIAPVQQVAEEPKPEAPKVDEPEAPKVDEPKPFRAHDYEDMLRECDLAKKDDEIGDKIDKLMKNTTGLYPLTDMSLTLEGKPVDILAALQTSWPWLLDQNKTYRVQIKLDTFVSKSGIADKML